ncbi:hypothetical protein GCM10025780_24030 [Frondihabitans cladoniiphilus]|uniref:Uncharacterized protein n=1 Tax=Frondihabitans cladoniiphilus TaxID=715785 RepID=A0ABP8W3K8_9MICO
MTGAHGAARSTTNGVELRLETRLAVRVGAVAVEVMRGSFCRVAGRAERGMHVPAILERYGRELRGFDAAAVRLL